MRTLILILTSIILYTYVMYYLISGVELSETPGKQSKDYTDVGGNIDIEYYLEVSEDSIWVENVSSHRVYGGTYDQLDSLILIDNL